MIQLHIFTIFMFKRDIRLFPSMSIQILVYFDPPDRPSERMKCDYAIANVRDFWRCLPPDFQTYIENSPLDLTL